MERQYKSCADAVKGESKASWGQYATHRPCFVVVYGGHPLQIQMSAKQHTWKLNQIISTGEQTPAIVYFGVYLNTPNLSAAFSFSFSFSLSLSSLYISIHKLPHIIHTYSY